MRQERPSFFTSFTDEINGHFDNAVLFPHLLSPTSKALQSLAGGLRIANAPCGAIQGFLEFPACVGLKVVGCGIHA
jgi:hypothetical protein